MENFFSAPVYANYNATTPLDHRVQLEMCRALQDLWANPSCVKFLPSMLQEKFVFLLWLYK